MTATSEVHEGRAPPSRWNVLPPIADPGTGRADTTLVVTTYNRPEYVRRLLAYLKARGLAARLLLVDASEEPVQRVNRGLLLSLFPEATFVSLPTTTSLVDTYKMAIHSVETEFLAYCPDDDFIDPDFISEAARFLRENDDYVLCAGRFCIASRDESTTFFGIQSNESVAQDDPLDRFLHLVANYWPTLRSVQRTTIAIDAATSLDAYMHHSVLGEALHGSVYALSGKIEVLDVVSQVQVEHHLRNQANDPSPRRLLCDDSFWRSLRVFHSCVEARLRALGRTAPPSLPRRVREAVFRHLSNNYWIWRDGALADLHARVPTLTEDQANDIYRWLVREIDRELLPELTRAEPLGGTGTYEHAFKVFHFVTMLQVADNGRVWRQSRVEMDGMGAETWGRFRDRWAAARAEAERLNAPVAADLTEALLSPGFLERYARFRNARLPRIRAIVGPGLDGERASTLIDALTVVAVLERIGRLGGHDLELARDIVSKLEERGDEAYGNLEEVSRWITRHPKPVSPQAAGSRDVRPRSDTLPTIAASLAEPSPPGRSCPPPDPRG